MFYALSKFEDEIADMLWTFAAMDPCTIQMDEGQETIYWDGLFKFKDHGIHVIGGPNWKKDKQTICDNFSKEVCDYAKEYGNPLLEPISV